MSIKVHIPTPMRQHTAGSATVEVQGATVQAALEALGQQFPDITGRMFDGPQLKRFLNVYLNDEDIRYLDNLGTAVKDGDELSIIPAVAGGHAVADELDEPENDEAEVPEGAAVFPDIPAELNVNPLLLAVVHAVVFLAGSADEIVLPAAADEALGYVAGYLQRLTGPDLARAKEDVAALLAYAKQQQWEKQLQHFIGSFLADLGVGGESEP